MKYFKYELWEKINSDVEEEQIKANSEWAENNEKYNLIFQKVKKRLPKKFLEIYLKNGGFHDFHPKNIEIVNGNYSFDSKNPPDCTQISITLADNKSTWRITYTGIEHLCINFIPNLTPNGRKRGLDDFGYDEFQEENESTLSHEILFASGSTVLIHFKKISISKII